MNIDYYKDRIAQNIGLSGKKSICLKFVFWYFKYQKDRKIDESRVPIFYASGTYIFERLLSYVFTQISWFWSKLLANKQKFETPRPCGQKFKNPRCKEMRFQDSFKTPPRSRDWKTNFRDHDFSGYHSPPLDIYFKVNICDIINTVMKKEILVKLTYTRHIHSATYIWSEPL